jgi:hypothetical protein
LVRETDEQLKQLTRSYYPRRFLREYKNLLLEYNFQAYLTEQITERHTATSGDTPLPSASVSPQAEQRQPRLRAAMRRLSQERAYRGRPEFGYQTPEFSGDYVLLKGAYAGRRISETPLTYIQWLASGALVTTTPSLPSAQLMVEHPSHFVGETMAPKVRPARAMDSEVEAARRYVLTAEYKRRIQQDEEKQALLQEDRRTYYDRYGEPQHVHTPAERATRLREEFAAQRQRQRQRIHLLPRLEMTLKEWQHLEQRVRLRLQRARPDEVPSLQNHLEGIEKTIAKYQQRIRALQQGSSPSSPEESSTENTSYYQKWVAAKAEAFFGENFSDEGKELREAYRNLPPRSQWTPEHAQIARRYHLLWDRAYRRAVRAYAEQQLREREDARVARGMSPEDAARLRAYESREEFTRSRVSPSEVDYTFENKRREYEQWMDDLEHDRLQTFQFVQVLRRTRMDPRWVSLLFIPNRQRLSYSFRHPLWEEHRERVYHQTLSARIPEYANASLSRREALRQQLSPEEAASLREESEREAHRTFFSSLSRSLAGVEARREALKDEIARRLKVLRDSPETELRFIPFQLSHLLRTTTPRQAEKAMYQAYEWLVRHDPLFRPERRIRAALSETPTSYDRETLYRDREQPQASHWERQVSVEALRFFYQELDKLGSMATPETAQEKLQRLRQLRSTLYRRFHEKALPEGTLSDEGETASERATRLRTYLTETFHLSSETPPLVSQVARQYWFDDEFRLQPRLFATVSVADEEPDPESGYPGSTRQELYYHWHENPLIQALHNQMTRMERSFQAGLEGYQSSTVGAYAGDRLSERDRDRTQRYLQQRLGVGLPYEEVYGPEARLSGDRVAAFPRTGDDAARARRASPGHGTGLPRPPRARRTGVCAPGEYYRDLFDCFNPRHTQHLETPPQSYLNQRDPDFSTPVVQDPDVILGKRTLQRIDSNRAYSRYRVVDEEYFAQEGQVSEAEIDYIHQQRQDVQSQASPEEVAAYRSSPLSRRRALEEPL